MIRFLRGSNVHVDLFDLKIVDTLCPSDADILELTYFNKYLKLHPLANDPLS